MSILEDPELRAALLVATELSKYVRTLTSDPVVGIAGFKFLVETAEEEWLLAGQAPRITETTELVAKLRTAETVMRAKSSKPRAST